MPFSQLGLSAPLVKAVKAMGYVDPTPIQLRTIPLVLEGKDLIGSAQTGTGKTAAFALPILQHLDRHQPKPAIQDGVRALVLEPTRELAAQVETAFRDYSRFTDLRTTVIFGGVGYGNQDKSLRQGTDIIVATPGRLLDQLERRMVSLGGVRYLVLDEADRMLDMGFMPAVRQIVMKCPRDRQTMLFSATMPPEIASLVDWALREPTIVEIGRARSPADTVAHALYPVSMRQKKELLAAILERLEFDSVLVFTRTKRRADDVAHMLKRQGHAVALLHSNRTQSERERALQGFRDGRYEVLVATDIAARGLDVTSITHVINFDIPLHPEDYVHRIGRTGRATMTGDAITLCTAEDLSCVNAIERFMGRVIEQKRVEGFPYESGTDTMPTPQAAIRLPSRGGGGAGKPAPAQEQVVGRRPLGGYQSKVGRIFQRRRRRW